MTSIFSGLPNDLIIKIIQIENDRKKYYKVVEQINIVTTYDKFCPSIREKMNGADDADPWDAMSASEIWGWRSVVRNDISWLNELWCIEKLKRKERMRYDEVIKQLLKYPIFGWSVNGTGGWQRWSRLLKKWRELGWIGDVSSPVYQKTAGLWR